MGKSSIYLRVDQCKLQTHVCFNRYKYASSLYTPSVYIHMFTVLTVQKRFTIQNQKSSTTLRKYVMSIMTNKNPIRSAGVR